jgi:hypothetical protein
MTLYMWPLICGRIGRVTNISVAQRHFSKPRVGKTCKTQGAMEYLPTSTACALRRYAAALMVIVVVVASWASAAREFSFGPAGAKSFVAELAKPPAGVPKPCQRAVLPGAVNTCPLASFSLAGFPADEPSQIMPNALVHAVLWHVMNSRLPAQCGASSPYRPPCPIV